MNGRLITLEGGEGAGKSTQATAVAAWLRARGRTVCQTREPGGSPLAEAIRGVVLADWAEGVTPTTEVLLMFAARAAHWHHVIAPALAAGTDVVCDRFLDSSFAYQGAKGVPALQLTTLSDWVLGGRRPDLTLLFDLPPEEGLRRARRRGEENRFEREALAAQQAIREGFLKQAEAAPERFVVIDARPSATQVTAAVQAVLEARL
jgi:dTMP kinase